MVGHLFHHRRANCSARLPPLIGQGDCPAKERFNGAVARSPHHEPCELSPSEPRRGSSGARSETPENRVTMVPAEYAARFSRSDSGGRLQLPDQMQSLSRESTRRRRGKERDRQCLLLKDFWQNSSGLWNPAAW